MQKIDLERRAEIGREKRAKTRALILEAAEMLLANRPAEALTVDAVVEAADVAKGTFYYHFQNIDDLTAAVGAKLGESFDNLLTPARLSMQDPIARMSFAFTQFVEKAIAEPLWAQLVVRSAQAPAGFVLSIRANFKADLTQAAAQGRIVMQDLELAADIGLSILLGVMRSIIHRGAAPDLVRQSLDAASRAIGVLHQPAADLPKGSDEPAR
jgi:AcrR family transcriptional regulator